MNAESLNLVEGFARYSSNRVLRLLSQVHRLLPLRERRRARRSSTDRHHTTPAMNSILEPARRARRIQLLDVATALVLVAAVAILLQPGSFLRNRFELGRRDYRTRASSVRLWQTLGVSASKLSAFDGSPDIIEFSDYECPFCRATTPAINSAVASGVKIAILHLPIKSRKYAAPAALVAMCFEPAGQFGHVHRLLLQSESWRKGEKSIEAELAAMGVVTTSDQATCIAGNATADRLNAHLALSDGLNIRETPTFVTRNAEFSDQRPGPAQL